MPVVLITGASRGIGRAAVLQFARAGYDVLAAVRSARDGESLVSQAGESVTAVQLDVTNDDDVAALDGALPPRLDALINCAGVVVGGPVEGLRLDDLRRQLEVNVTGQVAVTQAVLPRLRTSRGRIVFVSSLSGKVVTPMTGAYNASKFALEAVADALRLELWPWGIRVVVVEPAQTDTDMWRKADDMLEESVASLAPEIGGLYTQHIDGMRRSIPRSQRVAVPPERVAKTLLRAVSTPRPRTRYVVGAGPRAQLTMAQLMPTPLLDAALRRASGITSRS